MQIFIDESGTFDGRIPDLVSVLGSVVFPESIDYKLKKFFAKLEKRVTAAERSPNHEIKGSLLSDANLKKVFDFVAKNKDLRVSFMVFDPEINPQSAIEEWRQGQADKLQTALDLYMQGPTRSEQFKEELMAYINRTRSSRKISDQDFSQLALLPQLIETSIHKALVYFHQTKYAPYFKEFNFISDEKGNWKFKDYLNTLITYFLETGPEDPARFFLLNDMTFRVDHPIQRFLTHSSDGRMAFDLGKIFENKIRFEDSRQFLGLSLIDILVSGLRGIIVGQRHKELFNGIRHNCSYFKQRWEAITLSRLSTSKVTKATREEMYKYLLRPPNKSSEDIVGYVGRGGGTRTHGLLLPKQAR